MGSDICFFLKIRNFLECIFSIQKLKVNNGKVVETGYFYRICVIALITFFVYDALSINIEILITSMKFHYFSYIIAVSAIASILLALTLAFSAIQNIIFSPSKSHKIFKLFLEIEKQLGPLGKSFKNSLLLIHLLYVGIKLVFIFCDMRRWGFKRLEILKFHLMIMSIELEAIYYALEVYIVARYLEIINKKNSEMDENRNVLLERILLKIWSDTKNNNIKHNSDIKQITLTVEKLMEIMNNINSSSGTKVRQNNYF